MGTAFGLENLKRRNHLEDIDVDEIIIIKLSRVKVFVLDSSGSVYGPRRAFVNAKLDFSGKFIASLSYYQLLKKYSASWNEFRLSELINRSFVIPTLHYVRIY